MRTQLLFVSLFFWVVIACNPTNPEPEPTPVPTPPKPLGTFNNVSLDSKSSSQEISLPRDVCRGKGRRSNSKTECHGSTLFPLTERQLHSTLKKTPMPPLVTASILLKYAHRAFASEPFVLHRQDPEKHLRSYNGQPLARPIGEQIYLAQTGRKKLSPSIILKRQRAGKTTTKTTRLLPTALR